MSSRIPEKRLSVLSDQLKAAINSRPVRAAVFTTYAFDPGFFEMHVLPCLFDRPFSQADKIKHVQLDDALRTVEDVAVYYDRTALSQDAMPAHLDFRRMGVRRSTGVFHPKVVLLLVENPPEEEQDSDQQSDMAMSLIVGTLSANLTRGGWWENVEVGHLEEIVDKSISHARYAYRSDILNLIRQIKSAAPEDACIAMEMIHSFVKNQINRSTVAHHWTRGRHQTRLFVGQAELSTWLSDLKLKRFEWNLEIVSPYFRGHGAGPLRKLIQTLEPRETRVFLPVGLDGESLVHRDCFDDVAKIASWSTLPGDLIKPGTRAAAEQLQPRFVHAKLYRFWCKDGPEIVLVGSVNLTDAAHSRHNAGNFEAAFLVDATEEETRHWWLKPIEREPQDFTEEQSTEETAQAPEPIDISLRYDWSNHSFSYRLDPGAPGELAIAEPAGRVLTTIHKPETGRWIVLDKQVAAEIQTLLQSTSFVEVRHADGAWRVLIREEGMAHRPSLLLKLTPEDILRYWSLLSPAQKEQFLLERIDVADGLEGLPYSTRRPLDAQDTIFDRFAGIYHAFGHLHRNIEDVLASGKEREAEFRLFGEKHDSLPVLLGKILDREEQDPVTRFVTFLCAQQLRNDIKAKYAPFWCKHSTEAGKLDELLGHIDELSDRLDVPEDDREQFLSWYRSAFVRRTQHSEAAE